MPKLKTEKNTFVKSSWLGSDGNPEIGRRQVEATTQKQRHPSPRRARTLVEMVRGKRE